MLDCSDLRKGLKIEYEGDPYVITQFEFVKPGKGQALYKCRLKNMVNGNQFDRTFRSGEKFNKADLEERTMEFSYMDGENYCFMNTSTYEQEFLSPDQVADVIDFLKENTVCTVLFWGSRALGVTLPNFIELVVTKADPWARGDTATGNNKPVVLETGITIQVPYFIEEGEKIRIDTRTGQYVERVKE